MRIPIIVAIFVVFSIGVQKCHGSLSFYLADGNRAMENHLVHYDSNTGISSILMQDVSGNGVIYGWPGGMVRVGSEIYGVQAGQRVLHTIDPITGMVSTIGSAMTNVRLLGSLTYDQQNDVFFAVDYDRDKLFSINRYTGRATVKFGLSLGDVRGLAYNPADRLLYALDNQGQRLHSIDTVTGVVNAISTPLFDLVGGFYDEITFFQGDLFGTYTYWLANPNGSTTQYAQVRMIDLATGNSTDIGPAIADVSPHALVMMNRGLVPEPSTFLVWFSLVGLVVGSCRMHKPNSKF